ncbi:hypothetical protein BDN70DRAFT_869942 [Pholiota conissans]|uniref:Uncharacterized protein n=1 Tax=Pholiota conissans TaxID=109636 RepID=A0A9P5ZEU2_9AGAR|nr:hypothetical protein BDN70DRAFT_869942 [Pholiota conissans]
MPRPRPLTNVATAVPHGHPFGTDQQLTPRTPHSGSRTSRLEQGFSKLPLAEDANDLDYDEHDALQSAPLLASSSTARFSVHTVRSDRRDPPSAKSDGRGTFLHPTQFLSRALAQLPLAFGIFMAGVLLILIVLSLTRPEALHKYIGAKAPPTSSIAPPTSIPTSSISSSHAGHSQSNIHVLSYENYTKFPLSGHEYRAECAKLHGGYMTHGDYWDADPMGSFDVPHREDESICRSSITYMLDGTVGLSADLAIMAQAAALARERNRTFFINDSHWNRGKWLDHFDDVTQRQPGPQPGCKAPSPDELVACPRTARHWVISASTAKYHFAHGFSNHYENSYGHNLNRLKPIFEQAFHSFDSTIRPNRNVRRLIKLARDELSDFIGVVNERDTEGDSIYVGTHIRRGDRKSLSYSYKDRKIPLSEYLTAVSSTWTRLHPESPSKVTPVVYLATDSPEARQKFGELYDGEIFSLFDATNSSLRALASPREYNQTQFDELSLQARTTATDGMLVDLALVSGLWARKDELVPDATICALSSTVCRLSPIGLGWDRAFGKVNAMGEIDAQSKRWVDVDEKGLVVPVWQAFQLFN